MKDVFEQIDRWNSKFNILRDFHYSRKVALIFALTMIPVWFLLGFDSGTGILEEGLKLLPNLIVGKISFKEWVDQSYVIYGRSFHFSSFTIYGLLFYALSHHLEKIRLRGSKNTLYTSFLVLFNIGIFEFWYMATFAYFQMHRSLVEWFTSDFCAPPIYMNFLFLVLGVITVLALWVDSFILNNGKIIGRVYRFNLKLNLKTQFVLFLCVVSILFWVFYPFPVESVTIEGWTNSRFFPQTHYAYKDSKLYIQNDLLHLVNVIVKILFALSALQVVKQIRKLERES